MEKAQNAVKPIFGLSAVIADLNTAYNDHNKTRKPKIKTETELTVPDESAIPDAAIQN